MAREVSGPRQTLRQGAPHVPSPSSPGPLHAVARAEPRPRGGECSRTLIGRAIVPADTFEVGPTSGQFITAANGRTPPFARRQPVQGFSAVQRAPDGEFYGMPDNGFGAKANSADFLLSVYRLAPN